MSNGRIVTTENAKIHEVNVKSFMWKGTDEAEYS